MNRIVTGDCLFWLDLLEDKSIDCCVTSPPYYGLRDYGHTGQIGLEETPQQYVDRLVEVFREVKRVLKNDGTLWLNLGDSYCASKTGSVGNKSTFEGGRANQDESQKRIDKSKIVGLKPKDLIGIPWRVAFALQADGWYLRQDIIWHKPNPMPESVRDRCTKAHEYIFMLSKSPKYYYDAEAIRTPAKESTILRLSQNIDSQQGSDRVPGKANGKMKAVIMMDKQRGHSRRHAGFNDRWDSMTKEEQSSLGANKRSVWTVATKPFKEAHFATFPSDLIEPCILAGCRPDGTVLDPFMGAGTTAVVALQTDRKYLGIELNPDYVAIAENRISKIKKADHD